VLWPKFKELGLSLDFLASRDGLDFSFARDGLFQVPGELLSSSTRVSSSSRSMVVSCQQVWDGEANVTADLKGGKFFEVCVFLL
jgi:hypothetical protein